MRSTAVAAPLLLLLYGVLRWIDGWDGDRHNGPAWDVGHVAFFIGIALFAVLAAQMLAVVTRLRALAAAAVAAVIFGAGCFLWVITGDLFEDFQDRWPLPSALETTGPALFGVGLLTLMALLVADRRLPVWSPVLFLVGYAAISVDLDLLPFAALIIVVAFVPLARGATAARESLTRTP